MACLVTTTALLSGASGTPTPAPPVIGGPMLASAGVVVAASAGVPAPPVVPAESWLLADLDTGAVLAAKNAHKRLPPASTLKALTALTLLPVLDKEAVYTASWDDANAEGSRVGIVPDATYTVNQLFIGMLLPSGNDAALALANAAGGLEQTIGQMNATARKLQALDTHAVTPSGLDEDGQLSSAYDLALISRAALARDDFRAYVGMRSAAFPGRMPTDASPRSTFMIYNQNRLLGGYKGAIGVKTGYTTKARSTYVGAAERGGQRLVVTIMKTGAGSWKQAAALLDWGFAHRDQVSPVGELVDPIQPTPAAAASSPASRSGAAPGKAAAGSAKDGGGSVPAPAMLAATATLGLVGLLVTTRRAALRRRRQRERSRRAARDALWRD